MADMLSAFPDILKTTSLYTQVNSTQCPRNGQFTGSDQYRVTRVIGSVI